MTVENLRGWQRTHKDELIALLMEGTYQPAPAVKSVDIPKPDGKVRLLGIPSAADRLL